MIEKIRHLPKANEAGPSTSSPRQAQPEEDRIKVEAPVTAGTENMPSGSENTIAIPATNFKRYLEATGIRYINMGQASKIQDNPEWDLEEPSNKWNRSFLTTKKTKTTETTNDEKLLESLVGWE